ncbi:hypothetical protein OESDEN_07526 [Oesophagostomum dentatum]|uniref:Uncharacterized protein n=1 Tax=Oesophagostomum dentatum TaxID=61180 RepID=A0A0B1T8W0_OESDE|nr:hypothetical protein OESDEN_07526 [Oesophagostomum dentatum]
MIEFTICHFAKNQEILRCDPQPSLIVDTALSTLFGAARDIEDLTDEDLGITNRGNHISLNLLSPEHAEPRLRNFGTDVNTNGARRSMPTFTMLILGCVAYYTTHSLLLF